MIDYPINYSVTLFLFTCLFLGYGRDILISGINKLLHKSPNMDTLVMLGVLSSFVYSIYNMDLIF